VCSRSANRPGRCSRSPRSYRPRLAEAVERAQVKRLATKRELEAVIARAQRHPGVRALRGLIGEPFTRSKAERIVVALVQAARLPEPAFNATAEGFEVDVLWPRERVVLEFDSQGRRTTTVPTRGATSPIRS
jgi:hypothetical protein